MIIYVQNSHIHMCVAELLEQHMQYWKQIVVFRLTQLID